MFKTNNWSSNKQTLAGSKRITRIFYLLLALLPHAQGEHGMEVGTGEGQEGSVSRDPSLIGDQHHVTEVAVLPLLIKAVQDLRSLAH